MKENLRIGEIETTRKYLGNGNWIEWSNEIKNATIYILEEENTMSEMVKELYYYIEDRCEGLDSIYEDVILGLVGSYGLVVLKDAGLLETCGVINGRQLYVLCKLKGED